MYATLCLSVRYAHLVKLDSYQLDAMYRTRGGQTGVVRVLQLSLNLQYSIGSLWIRTSDST